MSKYIVQHNIKIKQLLNKQLLNTIFVENISCALDTKCLFFLLIYGSKFDQNIMDTPFLMSHITFNVILTITNAVSKNLPSSGTKWLPIMTYIHPLS